MKAFRLLLLFFLFLSPSVYAAEGLVATKSSFDAKETMDRFERAAKQKGLIIFLRVDHAAGAAKASKSLRPTELIVFGNPQGGTPFMECAQTVGIDLPLKALVWEDAQGQVWLGYNDPAFVAKRHQVAQCLVVANLNKTLAGIVQEAVSNK